LISIGPSQSDAAATVPRSVPNPTRTAASAKRCRYNCPILISPRTWPISIDRNCAPTQSPTNTAAPVEQVFQGLEHVPVAQVPGFGRPVVHDAVIALPRISTRAVAGYWLRLTVRLKLWSHRCTTGPDRARCVYSLLPTRMHDGQDQPVPTEPGGYSCRPLGGSGGCGENPTVIHKLFIDSRQRQPHAESLRSKLQKGEFGEACPLMCRMWEEERYVCRGCCVIGKAFRKNDCRCAACLCCACYGSSSLAKPTSSYGMQM
jgi:hypothetical protein